MKTHPAASVPIALAALLALAGAAAADDEKPGSRAADAARAIGDDAKDGPSITWPPRAVADDDDGDGPGWSFDAIPHGDLYPRYIADPRRPRIHVGFGSVLDGGIDETGAGRISIMAGGRFNFVRLHPDGNPDRGFQFDAEVGLAPTFDASNSLDNIGWDGFFGFGLSWKPLDTVAFRLAANHDSAHLGDEYVENTGRKRIGYTREEFALGISWMPVQRLRLYGEVGLAYSFDPEFMKRGRVQAGIEYETEPIFMNASLYAAVDAVFWEENGWEPSVTVQSGLKWRSETLDRDFRLGLQYYDGRSLMGEFFLERERSVTLGLWFDL